MRTRESLELVVERIPPFMTSVSATRRGNIPTDWFHLIRAEYNEIPGLHLTKRQVRRFWNLDAITSERVIEALETAKFLRRTATGAYVKAS